MSTQSACDAWTNTDEAAVEVDEALAADAAKGDVAEIQAAEFEAAEVDANEADAAVRTVALPAASTASGSLLMSPRAAAHQEQLAAIAHQPADQSAPELATQVAEQTSQETVPEMMEVMAREESPAREIAEATAQEIAEATAEEIAVEIAEEMAEATSEAIAVEAAEGFAEATAEETAEASISSAEAIPDNASTSESVDTEKVGTILIEATAVPISDVGAENGAGEVAENGADEIFCAEGSLPLQRDDFVAAGHVAAAATSEEAVPKREQELRWAARAPLSVEGACADRPSAQAPMETEATIRQMVSELRARGESEDSIRKRLGEKREHYLSLLVCISEFLVETNLPVELSVPKASPLEVIRRHTPFSPYVAPRFPHMSEINSLFPRRAPS